MLTQAIRVLEPSLDHSSGSCLFYKVFIPPLNLRLTTTANLQSDLQHPERDTQPQQKQSQSFTRSPFDIHRLPFFPENMVQAIMPSKATKNTGKAKAMNVRCLNDAIQDYVENVRCLYNLVQDYIKKQYERQERLEPTERMQALSNDGIVVTLPWAQTASRTRPLESYISLRFYPVAFDRSYRGNRSTDRIVTLWQPDKQLALRINLSLESRLRCRSGKTSLGDLFDIPQYPSDPDYPLRDAIAALKQALEMEITKELSENAEKFQKQDKKDTPKKRAVTYSLMLTKFDESSIDDEWETDDEEILVVEGRDVESKE